MHCVGSEALPQARSLAMVPACSCLLSASISTSVLLAADHPARLKVAITCCLLRCAQATCQVGPGGELLHRGGCELRQQPNAQAGGEVYQLGSGSMALGDAGVLEQVVESADSTPLGSACFLRPLQRCLCCSILHLLQHPASAGNC
jgi:hypothetical protein